MPANSGPSNAPVSSVAAVPARSQTLTFLIAGTQVTNPIFADGLAGIRAWFLQTAGAGAVTVTLQFADDANTAIGVPDWQPLLTPIGIALNVPSLTNLSLGARQYRASVTTTGAATVRTRLVGALT